MVDVRELKKVAKMYRRAGIPVTISLYLQYYDRNVKSIFKSFSINVGASSRTARVEWFYTVPGGRKAFLEFGYVRVQNASATALNGTVRSAVGITPSGKNATSVAEYFNFIQQFILSGETNIVRTQSLGALAVLQEGENLGGISEVGNSALGTDVTIEGYAKCTEFDT